MTDLRFKQTIEWERQHAEVRARAERMFREFGPADRLLVGIAEILETEEEGDTGLPSPLAADVLAAARGLHPQSEAAWYGITQALAAGAISGEPDAARLCAHAARLERSPSWAFEAFEAAVIERLRTLEPTTREAWLRTFEAPPPLPAPASPAASAVVTTRPAARWAIEDPFELWDDNRGQGAAIPLVSAYAPSYVLRRIDPDRWFRAVDRWGDGRLVFAALFGSHVLHEPETLVRWLESSSVAFDDKGTWTGRSAAIVLVYRAIEHAQALVTTTLPLPSGGAEEEEAIAQLRDRDLPPFFDSVWRSLLSRQDGLALGAAMHTRLSVPNNWPRRYRVNAEAVGRERLERALVAARPRARTLRDLSYQRRHPRGGVVHGNCASALTAIRCAAAIVAAEPQADEELFEWFAELLGADDTDWGKFAHEKELDALVRSLAGRFSRISSVVPRCDALYAHFERGRRRGEFGRTVSESDADRASLALLFLTLSVLEHQHARGVGGEIKDAAAHAHRRALRLALTSSPIALPTFSVRALLTYAIAVHVAIEPESLAACLEPTLGHPKHAAECAVVLLGVASRGALDQAASSVGGLAGLLARVETWANATDNAHDRAAAQALAAALGPNG